MGDSDRGVEIFEGDLGLGVGEGILSFSGTPARSPSIVPWQKKLKLLNQ